MKEPALPRFSRFVAGTCLLLVAVTVLALLFSLALRKAQAPGTATKPSDEGLRVPAPAGDLTFETGEDLAQLIAEKTAQLNKLEWIDAPAGIARIPIADAMRILAQRKKP